jgi:hypothetical protein
VQYGSRCHIPENRIPKIVKLYEYHTSDLELKENSFLFGILPSLMNEGDADLNDRFKSALLTSDVQWLHAGTYIILYTVQL